jgi:hypothetical protein
MYRMTDGEFGLVLLVMLFSCPLGNCTILDPRIIFLHVRFGD